MYIGGIKMVINAVSIKGQLRMDIPIHLDGRIYSYDEFIARFHNWNILRGLPPIYSGGNMELTPGGAMYYASMHLYLRRNQRGWLIVDRIVSPELSVRGAINDSISNLQFTHSHDLRHGKIATFNPFEGYRFDNVFKAGKRLRLVTGFRIKGYQPAPTRIGIPSGVSYPDGVIMVSSGYASQFQLSTSSNIYHEVDIDYLGQVIEDLGSTIPSDLANRVGISTLMTGDKIAGVLPSGHLIKGTIIIDPSQEIDMIIPKDSIKASGAPYNEYTRFSIRLRAADRLSTFNTRISYQIGQFIPEVIAYRISTLLRVPIQDRSLQSTYIIDSRARVASSVPELDTPSNLSILDLCRGLSNKEWGDEIKSTCISLFQWIEHDANGGEVPKSIHWAEDIVAGMSPYTNKRLMKAILKEVMIKIKKIISPPVKGAWGVASPHDGDIDTVSIPYRIYHLLDKPRYGAVVRFPVRGKSSLLRMKVVYHDDNDPTIRIHPTVMEDIQFGDYDGDLAFFITDPDIVESAVSVEESLSMNDSIQPFDPVPAEYPPLTEVYDRDIAIAQVYVAGWRSDIGLLCNMRDNLYGSGYINELQCLTFFSYAMQPALSQMDGALPIARYLLENPDLIAKVLHIDPSILIGNDGKLKTTPCSELRAIRGTLQYNDFIDVVNNSIPDDPYGILLEPFKCLPKID